MDEGHGRMVGAPREGGGVGARGHGWLAWLGVALAFGAIEAATVDFVFIMLAGVPSAGRPRPPSARPSPCRSSSRSSSSGVLLGVVRPWAKRRFATRPEGVTMGIAGYIGRVGARRRDGDASTVGG